MSSESLYSSLGNGKIPIEDILKCIICFNKVKQPQMCPNCSKLCCNNCIKKWLTEQKMQCPHCRCSLRISQLVNCRFAVDIASALEQFSGNKKEDEQDLCQIHESKMSYFCKTCAVPICSDCAMFGTSLYFKHKNHEFEHLSKIYENQIELVKSESQGLKKRLNELENQLSCIDEIIEKSTNAKEEKAIEIKKIIDLMTQKLEGQLREKLSDLLSQKNSLKDEIELLQSIQAELNNQLGTPQKSLLISKSSDLIKMLRDINNKPLQKFKKDSINLEFNSELTPHYDSAVFIMPNFSSLRKNTDLIYSDPIQINGLTWRLKVYPNGNGIAKGSYLSVFLEMVKGISGPTKFEYKVDMINQRSNDIVISKEFASDFETGECWGYNKFYKLDLLDREGFILPEKDTVRLLFFLISSCQTYYQHSLNLQAYIKQLEESKEESNKIINELKAKLNQEITTNKKIKTKETVEIPSNLPTNQKDRDNERIEVEIKEYDPFSKITNSSYAEDSKQLLSFENIQKQKLPNFDDFKSIKDIQQSELEFEAENLCSLHKIEDENNFDYIQNNLRYTKENEKKSETFNYEMENSITLEELCDTIKLDAFKNQLIEIQQNTENAQNESRIAKNLLSNFEMIQIENKKNESIDSTFAASIVEISENIMKKLETLKTSSKTKETDNIIDNKNLLSKAKHFSNFTEKENSVIKNRNED